MLKSTVLASGLVLAAGSTILIATAAQADINEFFVYHSQSYTQDASGLSSGVAGVQASIFSNVKGEFDGGTVTAPDGSVYSVLNQSSPGYPLDQFGAYFGPQPFGTFTANLTNSVTLATGSANFSYTSDHYPDVAPQVSNYAALQHFDPTKDNSVVLTSGFTDPGDEYAASTTFLIYDENTNVRLLQYSLSPGATVFDVAANTASLGEKIGYYFESDLDYATTVNGVLDVNIYRKITTGDINAASSVPEPSTWAMLTLGFAGVALAGLWRRRSVSVYAAVALLGSLGAGGSAQAATLYGSHADLIEDIPEEVFVETQIVGPEVEFIPSILVPAIEVDVTPDQIIFQTLQGYYFNGGPFDGFVLDFYQIANGHREPLTPPIVNVTPDASSFFPGVPISFTSDSVSFNLAGQLIVPEYKLVLDVTLQSTPPTLPSAPEPATWALALLGFAGLGALGRRRRAAARLPLGQPNGPGINKTMSFAAAGVVAGLAAGPAEASVLSYGSEPGLYADADAGGCGGSVGCGTEKDKLVLPATLADSAAASQLDKRYGGANQAYASALATFGAQHAYAEAYASYTGSYYGSYAETHATSDTYDVIDGASNTGLNNSANFTLSGTLTLLDEYGASDFVRAQFLVYDLSTGRVVQNYVASYTDSFSGPLTYSVPYSVAAGHSYTIESDLEAYAYVSSYDYDSANNHIDVIADFGNTLTYTLTGPTGSSHIVGESGHDYFYTPVEGVPEPSTWAMMLVGFVGLGALAWRGRPAAGGKSIGPFGTARNALSRRAYRS